MGAFSVAYYLFFKDRECWYESDPLLCQMNIINNCAWSTFGCLGRYERLFGTWEATEDASPYTIFKLVFEPNGDAYFSVSDNNGNILREETGIWYSTREKVFMTNFSDFNITFDIIFQGLTSFIAYINEIRLRFNLVE